MIRSLAVKWIITLLLSSLAGVILVGLFAYRATINEYDRLRLEQSREAFLAAITEYYEVNNSWDGVDARLRPTGNSRGDRHSRGLPQNFVVVNTSGIIVLGNGPFDEGDYAPTTHTEQDIPIYVNGELVGTLIVISPPPQLDPRERSYLERTNVALLVGALGASMVALLIGIILSRQFLHPLTELRNAIAAMRHGNLKQQVEVRTQDELGELARTFNQMSGELHRANLLREQMTADIAHDLRTPLLVIDGYLEALCDGTLKPTPERFEAMRHETTLLKRLIDDLRTLSLADAGKLKLVYQPVSPSDLLQQVRQSFEPIARQHSVGLQVDADSTLPEINIDRERTVQVLGNLISNAIRHTPEGGTVTLSAHSQADSVQLIVQDTGTGIPADKLPFIFERFYRIEEARQELEGESGLGLAIAKSIVESHGGTIEATSQPGSGTTIRITLPMRS